MAQKVTWTSRAADDLHHIFESLSAFSEARAEATIGEIIDTAFLLEQFPNLGRVVPEVNLEKIRELIVRQYRVVYTLSSEGQVEILAVRHSARPFSDF